MTLGSSGNHTNHYTNKATTVRIAPKLMKEDPLKLLFFAYFHSLLEKFFKQQESI
jgi:hypothetical protein